MAKYIGLPLSSLVCLLFIIISASQAVATPVDDLQPGHWYEAPNSNLETQFPNPLPPGNSGPSSIMNAWSSGAYDTLRNRLIVWGGGHMDYAGNEVYVFDIETLAWTRLDQPSTSIAQDSSGGRYPDGRPSSRHTYNYILYAPNVDLFFSLGFAAAYGPNAITGNEVDAYNFNTLSWLQKATKPNNGNAYGSITAYDPDTGLLWHHGTLSGKLSSYNPANNTWTLYSSSTSLEYYSTAAIDPTRNIMVTVGENQFYVWDLDNPNAPPTSPSTSGNGLIGAHAPGFVYDPVSDKFVGWNGGANVYLLDADTWTWSIVSPASGNTVVPSTAESRGTYGRFRYIPSKNAFVVVNRTNENVYFYKLTAGAGSNPSGPVPTVSITATPSTIDSGSSTTLNWTTSNADSCSASGAWSGSKSVSGSQVISNITINSTFTLNCTNTNGSASDSASVSIQAPADLSSPAVPQNLNWTSTSNSHINLSWSASTDSGGSGLSGYRVYRDGTLIATVNATQLDDVVLAAGSDYVYGVSAFDGAGNESARQTVTATTQSGGNAVLRINAGGGNYTDSFGRLWQSDWGFNTGNAGSTSNTISGSREVTLFQTQRWDALSAPELQYSFNVANGDYTVNLYFAEYYSGAFGTGLRTFNVKLEGVIEAVNLDVYNQAGANTALVKSLSTTVSDGQLNIEWVHVAENTMISAIEVLQDSVSSVAPTVNFSGSPMTVSANGTAQLLWSSQNASSCVASGAWSGSKGSSGSQMVGPLTSSQQYLLTCSGTGGSIQRSVVITVEGDSGGGGTGGGSGGSTNQEPGFTDDGANNDKPTGLGAMHPLTFICLVVFYMAVRIRNRNTGLK